MDTIGVVISKEKEGPPPRVEDPEGHRRLLKSLYNGRGKLASWEIEEESIKQAKIQAQSIIERLDPEHIENWGDLMEKLNSCLEDAKRYLRIQGKI